MFCFLHKYRIVILTALRFILYALILFICKNDIEGAHRWITFWLYVSIIASVFIFHLVDTRYDSVMNFSRKKVLWFLGLLTIVTCISFFSLKTYPLVSVGDELRDSGLDAVRVLTGETRNFFAYGEYNGFGNIIPVIASFFYRLFGASVYTYRVPAALFSIFDVGLMYVLLQLITNKKTIAFIGGLAYSSLALHLFYARTELVVAFDGFWTTAILLAFYLWFKKRRTIDFIFLGTVLGAAANFHSSVRIISVAVFVLAIMIEVKRILFNNVKMSFGILLLVLYSFIGFGPTLLYSNQKSFFQSDKLGDVITHEKQIYFKTARIEAIKQNYIKSLMVWFYEPAMSHYQGVTPLLPSLFGLLFILGIGYAVFVVKEPFLYILLGFIFALPLTNSAITNAVNADNRLISLLPFGVIFVSLAIQGLLELLSKSLLKYVFLGILGLYIIYQISAFFYFQPAVKNRDIKDFLSMNIIYFLQSYEPNSRITSNAGNLPPEPHKICLYLSPANVVNLDVLHYKEQYQYFLPNSQIVTTSDTQIPDNEAYIFRNECPVNYLQVTKQDKMTCAGKHDFLCPLDYKGSIIVHY